MESSEEFKNAFSFLERDLLMRLTRFDYAQNFFGNIWAEYEGSGLVIKIVRDRGILETAISKDGLNWQPFDALLQAIGEPPSVTVSDQGWPIGANPTDQASALRQHLRSIHGCLVGA